MRLILWRPLVALTAAALLVLAGLAMPAPSNALSAGQIDGDLPPRGPALVVWGGGTPEALAQAARDRGCTPAALWIATDGRLLVYISGAPDVVNAAFSGQFAGGEMPGGIAAVVICGPPVVANTGGPGSGPPAAAPTPSLEQQFAEAAFDAINGARQANGLPALGESLPLRAAAEQYVTLLLSQGGQLNHELDGMPWDRAQREGYPSSIVGEVIASRATSEPLNVSADTAVLLQTWLDSPPHRDILMGADFAFTDLGVGCAVGKDASGLNLVICVAMTGMP